MVSRGAVLLQYVQPPLGVWCTAADAVSGLVGLKTDVVDNVTKRCESHCCCLPQPSLSPSHTHPPRLPPSPTPPQIQAEDDSPANSVTGGKKVRFFFMHFPPSLLPPSVLPPQRPPSFFRPFHISQFTLIYFPQHSAVVLLLLLLYQPLP